MTDGIVRLSSALADRYRIERELGAGGMATVYLAEDLKHGRRVAIKVLRPELAAVIGAERFLREIKTIATLQHPHILGLIDSGEVQGTAYYVMLFVEGESLRDRLNREKQLPVNDAVRLATEIASALDYAHRHGVIHRDIKPENILLHDGSALVADFGIALALSSAGGTRMTETGMSLGTPHYMSPEQAMGEREITARSDVYALGVVTYEMLTGDPPFTGSTAQAIVARVMTEAPRSLTTQRHTIPEHVEAAVLTALEKLPADRFASAAEFAGALGGKMEGRTVGAPRRMSARPRSRLAAGVTAIVALALIVLAYRLGRGASTGAGPSVYDAVLPDSAAMIFAAPTATTGYGSGLRNLSASPTNDFAVYAAQHGDSAMLWYRSLRDATARPIPGTVGATVPRISPDGKRVAYFAAGRIMVVPIAGGEPRRLLEVQAASSLDWIAPDTLLVFHLDGNAAVWLDPEAGQTRAKAVSRCAFGSWIPGERSMLCNLNGYSAIIDPQTGERHTLRSTAPGGAAGKPLRGTAVRIVDGRYAVYLSADGDLRAASYDSRTHQVGRPVSLLDGIRREGVGEGQFDITGDGTLVFAPGVDATIGRMVRLRQGGTPEPLAAPAAAFQRFDLSPNGRWLAAAVLGSEGQELRVYDLRDAQQLNWLRAEYVRHPLWSASGDELGVGVREGSRWFILRGVPNGARGPDTLLARDSTRPMLDPVDFHATGDMLLQNWDSGEVSRIDPTTAHAQPTSVVHDGARFASVSPDGKHLLYQTIDGSRVIVTSYPEPGKRWQLASGGVEPLWLSPSEVLYRAGVAWYKVRVNPSTGEPAGAGTFWARDPRFSDTSGWSNRPSHDGGIIYVEGPAQTQTSYLRVVPNWQAQMKAVVDAANR